jgi:hypothetical protein
VVYGPLNQFLDCVDQGCLVGLNLTKVHFTDFRTNHTGEGCGNRTADVEDTVNCLFRLSDAVTDGCVDLRQHVIAGKCALGRGGQLALYDRIFVGGTFKDWG